MLRVILIALCIILPVISVALTRSGDELPEEGKEKFSIALTLTK